jgi:hypothetical protein
VLVARPEVMVHEGAKENISVKYISVDKTAGQASRSYKSTLEIQYCVTAIEDDQ